MTRFRHASAVAIAVLAFPFALVGCTNVASPGSPEATPAATPAHTVAATAAPVTSAPATLPAQTAAATATPAASVEPSAGTSVAPSGAPITTPVPGSSLDPTLSDAGVAGRITIPDDTRNDWSGTHEILGREADGSECSYSFEGDTFTAVAWYDDAPDGMIHQFSVSIPTDEMPANDGEQRAGISDGSVYVDFVNESGFGTAYTGSQKADDRSSSSIDVVLNGEVLTFSFSATTWDSIDFTGQMMCTGMSGLSN